MTELEKARLLKEAHELVNRIDATVRFIVESIKKDASKKAA